MVAFLDALRKFSPTPSVTQSISFNFTEMSDETCLLLLGFARQCPLLATLELFGNKIGDSSCSSLASLLQSTQLKRLKIGDNSITDMGAILLGEGLRSNNSLIQLHLGNNLIGDVGVAALAAALEENTSLTSLGLRDNKFGSLGVSSLARLLSSGCCITDLQLKGNMVGEVGAWHIAGALKSSTALRVLELPATHLRAEDAQMLAQGLKSNSLIHAINLNNNLIGDEGVEALALVLLANVVVSTVGLRANGVGPRGGQALANMLRKNVTVMGLDVGMNQLGSLGATAIAGALCGNSSLVSLDLHANQIQLEGVLMVASALKHNTSIRHLDMSSNFSGNVGASGWAAALRANTSLTRLCLTDNEITEHGGADLLSALEQNQTLRSFGVGGQSVAPPLGNQLSIRLRKAIQQQVKANDSAHFQQSRQSPAMETTGHPSSRNRDSSTPMDGGRVTPSQQPLESFPRYDGRLGSVPLPRAWPASAVQPLGMILRDHYPMLQTAGQEPPALFPRPPGPPGHGTPPTRPTTASPSLRQAQWGARTRRASASPSLFGAMGDLHSPQATMLDTCHPHLDPSTSVVDSTFPVPSLVAAPPPLGTLSVPRPAPLTTLQRRAPSSGHSPQHPMTQQVTCKGAPLGRTPLQVLQATAQPTISTPTRQGPQAARGPSTPVARNGGPAVSGRGPATYTLLPADTDAGWAPFTVQIPNPSSHLNLSSAPRKPSPVPFSDLLEPVPYSLVPLQSPALSSPGLSQEAASDPGSPTRSPTVVGCSLLSNPNMTPPQPLARGPSATPSEGPALSHAGSADGAARTHHNPQPACDDGSQGSAEVDTTALMWTLQALGCAERTSNTSFGLQMERIPCVQSLWAELSS
eukprot:GGOE01021335.1.p1 GENE.GGOE01021335.1~~GGOE01021335.1.p1  ORF type:complete len:939 (+),score=92.36 GGOE01021335.1:222-2819(+)